MPMRRLVLIPTLATLVAGSLSAADTVNAPIAALANPLGNQHYLQGSLLIDGLFQRRLNLDGDLDTDTLLIRAEYGAKIELEDRMEVNLTLAYDGVAGDSYDPVSTDDSDEETSGRSVDGEVAFDDAWVTFKKFIHPSFNLKLGRMPVAYNLRADHGAFLFDSRADAPLVTSWDGVSAGLGIDNWNIEGFYHMLNQADTGLGIVPGTESEREDSYLYGLVVDWQPQAENGQDIFFTASYTVEKKPVFGDFGAAQTGHLLRTWYIGTEWKLLNGWDFYAEYADQSGQVGPDLGFSGSAWSVGTLWHIPLAGNLDRMAFGIQYDWLSGDNDPDDGDYQAFVNSHEGTQDTLIVEHERYGELSELVQGNLEAIKISYEWVFVPSSNFRMQITGANYRFDQAPAGVSDGFGNEVDMIFSWDYNYYTNLRLFGAVFMPDRGYETLRGDDGDVTLVGFSSLVQF